MRSARPCAICGKMTVNFLFNDKVLGVPICSKKCEYEYLKNLTPEMKEQVDVVRFLDGKIEENKKRNKIGWGIACSGLILILIGLLMANPVLFIIANIIVLSGAFSTRHFEDRIEKLMKMRKRIVI